MYLEKNENSEAKLDEEGKRPSEENDDTSSTNPNEGEKKVKAVLIGAFGDCDSFSLTDSGAKVSKACGGGIEKKLKLYVNHSLRLSDSFN